MTTAEAMAKNIRNANINTMPELRNLLQAITNELKNQNTKGKTK